jgi:hypothetical protein
MRRNVNFVAQVPTATVPTALPANIGMGMVATSAYGVAQPPWDIAPPALAKFTRNEDTTREGITDAGHPLPHAAKISQNKEPNENQ